MVARTKHETLELKDCRILESNFAGIKNSDNPIGIRNFRVNVTDAEAATLMYQGVRVAGSPGEFSLHISLPRIFDGPYPHDDHVPERADVTIVLRKWEFAGETGCKAYLDSIKY